MKRYVYQVVEGVTSKRDGFHISSVADLNKLGSEGWLLCAHNGSADQYIFCHELEDINVNEK